MTESVMTRTLRIAVADDEPDMLDYMQQVLPMLGHEVVAAASNGRDLVDACRRLHPDLIITDIKMPDLDGIDAVAELHRSEMIPVILISAHHDQPLVQRAASEHVLAYIVKPIKKPDLETAITIAMCRFDEFQAMRKEAATLRQTLEDRKIIERAKGIVMRKTGLDEESAFRRLQSQARNQNMKLVEVARSVLTAEQLIQGNG